MSYDPLEYFKQKYPLEYTIFLECMTRFEDIRRDVYQDLDKNVLPLKIEFGVSYDNVNQKTRLEAQPDGMFFIASIVRTVLNNIYSNNQDELAALEEKAKQRIFKNVDFVICWNCRYPNNKEFNFCEKCKTQLKRLP